MKKDVGVLADKTSNMSQQCVLSVKKANYILVYSKRSVARSLREVIFPLYLALETCAHLWNAQYKEKHRPVHMGPEKDHKNDQGSGG